MGEQTSAIDTTVPHSARVWNYWFGGKDNYPVDRQATDQFLDVFPGMAKMARASRASQGCAVRHLAGERGVRQSLDMGTGLPTAEDTHEAAQSVAPNARIVYVDKDPLVLTHARALLTSRPEQIAGYLEGLELFDPGVVSVTHWRPDLVGHERPTEVDQYSRVGRKV